MFGFGKIAQEVAALKAENTELRAALEELKLSIENKVQELVDQIDIEYQVDQIAERSVEALLENVSIDVNFR